MILRSLRSTPTSPSSLASILFHEFSCFGKMNPKQENVVVDAACTVSSGCDASYDENWPSLSASNQLGARSKRRIGVDLRPSIEQKLDQELSTNITLPVESSHSKDSRTHIVGEKSDKTLGYFNTCPPEISLSTSQYDCSLPTSFGKKSKAYYVRVKDQRKEFSADLIETGDSGRKEDFLPVEPFDICLDKSRKSWRKRVTDKRVEVERNDRNCNQILRPGMVLLKQYISPNDQVNIVKKCRELGMGPGGFYQPGYNDGAKLRLQMMCLGRNWDPQTKYKEPRRSDGTEAPDIPDELVRLVNSSLRKSHDLIRKQDETSIVEDILPSMSPDICIVNFYKTTGRLGLHQDRDESPDSLRRGLPVVSFSIGDSAEFLYGDKRDVDKAEEVLLESGDVLIFGGESRHVFHGVKYIIPDSAPPPITTLLRPGRLNLTFRQF